MAPDHFSTDLAARNPDPLQTLLWKLAVLTAADCDGARLTVPTLSPMPGRHTHEVEHLMMIFRNPWVLRHLGYATGWRRRSFPCRRRKAISGLGRPRGAR